MKSFLKEWFSLNRLIPKSVFFFFYFCIKDLKLFVIQVQWNMKLLKRNKVNYSKLKVVLKTNSHENFSSIFKGPFCPIFFFG